MFVVVISPPHGPPSFRAVPRCDDANSRNVPSSSSSSSPPPSRPTTPPAGLCCSFCRPPRGRVGDDGVGGCWPSFAASGGGRSTPKEEGGGIQPVRLSVRSGRVSVASSTSSPALDGCCCCCCLAAVVAAVPYSALALSASRFLILAFCMKFDVLSSWVSLMVVQLSASTASSSPSAADDATEDLLPMLRTEVSLMPSSPTPLPEAAATALILSISAVASRPRLKVFSAASPACASSASGDDDDDGDSLSTRLAFPSPSALFALVVVALVLVVFLLLLFSSFFFFFLCENGVPSKW